MALKDWSVPSTSYDLPGGGTVAVQGVSVDQIAALVRDDRAALIATFDKLMAREDVQAVAEQVEAGEDVSDTAGLNFGDVGAELLTAAPALVAKIIAWSAGEPDAVDQARRLPFPTQLELLVEIGRLTFEKTTPEAFLEAVITLARSANRGVAAANQISR